MCLMTLYLFIVLSSACKHPVFVKRKYNNGWYSGTSKNHKSATIYSSTATVDKARSICSETNYRRHQTNAVSTNRVEEENTQTLFLNKAVKANASSKTISHLTNKQQENFIWQQKQIHKKGTVTSLTPITKQNKRTYLISFFVFIAFWVAYILVYSPNLVAQFAGSIFVLQIVGYIILSMLVLVIIYVIADQLKKRIKD